jgi:hypothetical protein
MVIIADPSVCAASVTNTNGDIFMCLCFQCPVTVFALGLKVTTQLLRQLVQTIEMTQTTDSIEILPRNLFFLRVSVLCAVGF